MNPDFTKAASQATRALMKYQISRTPIYPQQALQQSPLVTMISFADMAEMIHIERNSIISAMHKENELVMTSVHNRPDGTPHYIFAFNREKPIGRVRLALAAELGHVYMGHVGYRDNETLVSEALCFAHHFLFPRAMIRLLEERGVVLGKEMFARIFGDSKWCLPNILASEPVTIPAELNRALKDQFAPYVAELEEAGVLALPVDPTEGALDFSKYMAGYEE